MSLKRTSSERRADRNIYRRESHVEKNPAFRLAGSIFYKADTRKADKEERRQALQKSRPVGYGFATDDIYGPDNSWDSPDSLIGIHDRGHYIVGENRGFFADSR